MKRNICPTLCTFVVLVTLAWLFSEQFVAAQEKEVKPMLPSVSLQVSLVEKAVYTEDSIPLKVSFENVSDHNLRILRVFEPTQVFFTLRVTREDGTPLRMPGGGKVSLRMSDFKYIELKKNEMFGIRLDVAQVAPFKLESGKYKVSVTYHNQYGQDCLKGEFASDNSVPFEIKVKDETKVPQNEMGKSKS